ncbi:hypothetical protein P4H42_00325 [Paenibacillus macerans]|uniref:hypothetical protein n=1 Tax=Paenibacillus macerans TaxID=44252 RepID=UPI002DBDBEC9|nr:hypothetical protein [Paenibacillus macerans]MEC0328071.1 hypothetical protein [Paenibacillus macerans]
MKSTVLEQIALVATVRILVQLKNAVTIHTSKNRLRKFSGGFLALWAFSLNFVGLMLNSWIDRWL